MDTSERPAALAGELTNDLVIKDLQQAAQKSSLKELQILDLATGQGYNPWKLQQDMVGYNLKITCADIDTGQFKLPREGNINYISTDLNKEFNLGKFDFILATEIIEHLENPYQFIRNCTAGLKEGGVLYLTTPNVASLNSVIKIFFTAIPALFGVIEQYGHIMPFFPFMLKIALGNIEAATGKKFQTEVWYNKNIIRLFPTRKTIKVFGNHSRLLGESAIYKITLLS